MLNNLYIGVTAVYTVLHLGTDTSINLSSVIHQRRFKKKQFAVVNDYIKELSPQQSHSNCYHYMQSKPM